MRRPLQITMLALCGLGLLHASLFTDLCLRYVRPGMRPLLVASGVVLLALAAAESWSAYRNHGRREGGDGHEGHGHEGGGDGQERALTVTRTAVTVTTTPACPASPGCCSCPR